MKKSRAISNLTVLILVIASVILNPVIGSHAAVKPGAVCKKAKQVRIVSEFTYRCVKSGKKLVWRKIAAAPVVIPAVEVTPSPSPSPSVEASPTPTATPSPTIPSDFLSFKNAMVYGLNGTRLIRKADSGLFFEDDSRGAEVFSEVRRKAFAELNQDRKTSGHPNIEFTYEITPSFPVFLTDFIKHELSAAADLWNDFFTRKTQVRVTLVTEQDQEFIKQDPWIGANFPPFLKRLESRRERPFISGGGIYWNDSRRTVGQVILATASYLDLGYINYEWPQVARHEFFHVVQDFALYGESQSRTRSRFLDVQPQHYREGAANTISYLTTFRNLGWASDALDWMVWRRARGSKDWIRVASEADVIKLMRGTENFEPEAAFEMSYAVGSLMYEWVIAEFGFEKFTKLVQLIGKRATLDQALKESLGIGKEDLYERSAPYLLSVFDRLRPYVD